MAKAAAHANNFVNDPAHKGKLDSKDDQYSIGVGYNWTNNPKNNKVNTAIQIFKYMTKYIW